MLSKQLSAANRPRSIYQYSNMAPRLSGQTSIFGVVFFVSNSLLGIERQKKLEKFAILTRKPRSHVRILIYRTWPISNTQPRFQRLISCSLDRGEIEPWERGCRTHFLSFLYVKRLLHVT